MAVPPIANDVIETPSPLVRDISPHIHEIGHEELDPHIRDDHGDPHRAALQDLSDNARPSFSTCMAIFFLGFTVHPALSFTLLTVFPVSVNISLDLQGSTTNIAWIASGWSLAGSVAFVIAGQLSDYFGRRYVVLFGQAVLIIGHIVGATAQSLGQVIAGMALLGLGVGIIFVFYPGIAELLPNKYRSIGLASTEIQLLPFSTFGALIARSLTKHASWRWIFYLGIISGVIAISGTALFYHPPSKPIRDRSRRQLLSELDYLGLTLYTLGVTLFLLGLGWAGTQYAWKSAAVLVPLILGVLIFFAAMAWDFSGRPKRPIFPLRLFKEFRNFVTLLFIIFVTGLVYISSAALIPQQISYVWTSDSIKAGYYNIPAGFGASLGGSVLGSLIYRIKHVPIQLAVGVGIQTLFTGLLALINPNRIAMGIVFQFIASTPFGWVLIGCYVTAGIHVPQRDLGLAYGLIGMARFLGGAVGSAIFFTILDNRAATKVPERVAAAVLPLGYSSSDIPSLITALSVGNTAVLAKIPTQVIQAASGAIQWGYNDAFRVTWLASIPFGVIACIFAFLPRDPSPYFTTHTAVTMKKETFGSRGGRKSSVLGAEKAEAMNSTHMEG